MAPDLDQQLDITIQSISVNEVNHMLKKIDEQRYKGISTVLEEELSQLEDSKKILIKQIDDLDSQKEWVDWIAKYGDGISKEFKKPTSKLLEEIVDRIVPLGMALDMNIIWDGYDVVSHLSRVIDIH